VKIAHQCIRNPVKVLPTPEAVAELHQWYENGVIMIPNTNEIYMTLRGNTLGSHNETHRELFDAYDRGCRERLSMNWFASASNGGTYKKKSGPTAWVETEAIGTSFKHLIGPDGQEQKQVRSKVQKQPKGPSKHQKMWGPLPFQCPYCLQRFAIPQHHKAHHDVKHNPQGIEYVKVAPSLDPDWDKAEEQEELYYSEEDGENMMEIDEQEFVTGRKNSDGSNKRKRSGF